MSGRGFSVVVPAHDERRVIARTLSTLLADDRQDMQVVVVCNGCVDGTEDVVAQFAPRVQLVTLAAASKVEALQAGDALATRFPRLYLDADVDLTGDAACRLAATVAVDGVHAAAPARVLDLDGCSWAVRAYYRVWQALPAAADGLFGRGVVAMDAEGHARIAQMPPVLADDLFVHDAFLPHERVVVAGVPVRIHAPRHLADLVRRRVRTTTGNAQQRGPGTQNRPVDLLRVLAADPRLLPHVVVFLSVAARARRLAARAVAAGDFSTWLRDDSSRG